MVIKRVFFPKMFFLKCMRVVRLRSPPGFKEEYNGLNLTFIFGH
jgi:hypothetical protein